MDFKMTSHVLYPDEWTTSPFLIFGPIDASLKSYCIILLDGECSTAVWLLMKNAEGTEAKRHLLKSKLTK